ncbi:hypothetical protein AGR1A_Cc50303 [Agrobacterium fabacearum CFBP 5771]|nr:hypothetical protein AGR1A_Cc50303 [Agrobacterium fabacearum CFBP 5771]
MEWLSAPENRLPVGRYAKEAIDWLTGNLAFFSIGFLSFSKASLTPCFTFCRRRIRWSSSRL